MKVALVPLTLALLVGCSGAPTQRASDVEPLKMDNVGVFLEYQESLRDGYQDGSLGSLNEREQRLFEDSQRTIERLLGDVDSVDELSANQKVELYNAQEAINAIIRGNAENRQICRRQVQTLGSNIRKTECYTARQRDEMLRQAQRGLDWVRRNSGQCPDCGG